MSVSSIQSTARTTPVHPQQDTPFSIADGVLPAGKGDSCDDVRGPLFGNINSAIDLNQAEERGETVNGREERNLYTTLLMQAGSYRGCNISRQASEEDKEAHSMIDAYLALTRWGSTPEQAIGRLANE
jgi:hypothetical protein